MAGMSNALISKLLNATTPTGASGAPGSFAAYGGASMKITLHSAASSAASAGAELANGNGYATGGQNVGNQSSTSSNGSSVTLPAVAALSWTNSSGGWSIVGFELTDSAGVRTWFGNFTGQPISVAAGNTFQIAVGGITIGLA